MCVCVFFSFLLCAYQYYVQHTAASFGLPFPPPPMGLFECSFWILDWPQLEHFWQPITWQWNFSEAVTGPPQALQIPFTDRSMSFFIQPLKLWKINVFFHLTNCSVVFMRCHCDDCKQSLKKLSPPSKALMVYSTEPSTHTTQTLMQICRLIKKMELVPRVWDWFFCSQWRIIYDNCDMMLLLYKQENFYKRLYPGKLFPIQMGVYLYNLSCNKCENKHRTYCMCKTK